MYITHNTTSKMDCAFVLEHEDMDKLFDVIRLTNVLRDRNYKPARSMEFYRTLNNVGMAVAEMLDYIDEHSRHEMHGNHVEYILDKEESEGEKNESKVD